ncbi:MAG: lipoprotein-releasing system permease protein [Acidobacteriota bacterium]|jgi:lipoprotein-releasing system permease protein|nr:lipoprotein-releasing system permease protein [Acidobacteriota bacterium]
MPYELFLALRYLRVRRGRRVARWTALAAVVGIACGVASLVVALALANGFRDELRDKILRGTAHVTLAREGGMSVDDARRVVARVRSVEGVRDAAPTTYEGALLSGPRGATYTLLRGLDARSARARADVQGTLTKGQMDALFQIPESQVIEKEPVAKAVEQTNGTVPIIIGEELATRTGLNEVGDEGWVLSGVVTPESQAFEPRAQRVRIAGLFRSGLYEYDSAWTYLSLENVPVVEAAQPSSVVVSIEARDMDESGEVARRVREALGAGWTTVDWREANRPLFEALALERRTVALIIMLITIVAALNITTTLALVVVERRADIAVLAALGARALSVTLVFMIEGALVGVVGALAGAALGLCACFAADRFKLIRLPADVYSLSAVPLHPHVSDVVWPALAAFVVSLLATLYPAWQAARVRPAEVLRYE